MNPIFEMLFNGTDNFNKKYQTSIDPNKTYKTAEVVDILLINLTISL